MTGQDFERLLSRGRHVEERAARAGQRKRENNADSLLPPSSAARSDLLVVSTEKSVSFAYLTMRP